MDRDNGIIIAAIIFILAVVMFASRTPETTETQLIKIGVMTYDEKTNASEVFLATQAINDVNQYCLNQSLPYRFQPVYRCNNHNPRQTIGIVDEFHENNVSIIVGFRYGSTLDTCDYQSKLYGMVIVSPYADTSFHRDVYPHIIQLTPIEIHDIQVVARIMADLGFMETVILTDTYQLNSDYTVEEFKVCYEELGGEITDMVVFSYEINTGYTKDKLTELENIVSDNTAIFFPGASIYSPFYYEIPNHPDLLNYTWFSNQEAHGNNTREMSKTPEMVEMQLIHPNLDEEPDQSNPKYQALNNLYYAEFGENMTRYTGNFYDAVWLSALTVIETGEYNNLTFIETLPEVARDYTGVTGNCSLDQYGDRLNAGYNIYKYVLRGEKVYVKEIGYCDTSEQGIEWYYSSSPLA